VVLRNHNQVFRFGPFELDAVELRRAGRPVRIARQPLAILRLLVVRAGEVVTRPEIQRQVWGEHTHVDFELSLNYSINRMRAALGDPASAPEYVETIPRAGYRFIAPVQAQAASRQMIAVLPLDNLSGDPAQEYLSEGFTEEIITELGRLTPDRLGVIARYSAATCKQRQMPLDQMAAALGVDHFLEGSVRRAGERVRVSVQLIRAADQTHLWAETYERPAADILALQADVGRRVIASLVPGLLGSAGHTGSAAPARVPEGGTNGHAEQRLTGIDTAAHDCYLKGRFFWNRWNPESLQLAAACFEEAIAIAPQFAAAHSGLADACSILGFFNVVRPRDVYPRAVRAAARAVELDECSAEAHASLAWVKCCYEWDWDGVRREFDRAIALNPNYVQAHAWRAFYLTIVGRMDEAVESIRRAKQLDPLSLLVNTDEACFLYFARRYDEAVEQCRRTIALNPAFGLPHHKLGLCHLALGQVQSAIAEFEEAVTLWGGHAIPLASLGQAFALAGQHGRARSILAQLEQASREHYVSPLDLSFVWLALGDVSQGIALMERACEERDSRLPFIRVAPGLEPLAGHPSFQRLLERMGLASPSSRQWRR
jgi:TolB-like protein/tetratricopeptide (TPR) repeat protein